MVCTRVMIFELNKHHNAQLKLNDGLHDHALPLYLLALLFLTSRNTVSVITVFTLERVLIIVVVSFPLAYCSSCLPYFLIPSHQCSGLATTPPSSLKATGCNYVTRIRHTKFLFDG